MLRRNDPVHAGAFDRARVIGLDHRQTRRIHLKHGPIPRHYLHALRRQRQDLFKKLAALAIFLFGLIFVPTFLLALVMVGTSAEDMRLERLGLLLPALIDGAMIAVVLSVMSLSVSALRRSGALAITARR
jgi:hypothetical protein